MTRCTTICCFILLVLLSGCGKKPSSIDFRGTVTGMIGDVEIYNEQKMSWEPLEFGANISLGDSIRTQAESQVEITFNGDNTVKLDENTTVRVKQSADSAGNAIIDVFTGDGTVLSNIKKLAGGNDKYRVCTPTAVAAIRGTFFSVHFDAGAHVSHVHCLEGKVWVFNPFLPPAPPLIIVPGFFTSVSFGMAPVIPVHIPPGQWKKLYRVMPHPMFTRYTKKFKVKGIDDLFLLPGPVDIRGKHIKIKPGKLMVPGSPGHGSIKDPFKPGKGSGKAFEMPKGHAGPNKMPTPSFKPQGGKPANAGGEKGAGEQKGKGKGGGGKGKNK